MKAKKRLLLWIVLAIIVITIRTVTLPMKQVGYEDEQLMFQEFGISVSLPETNQEFRKTIYQKFNPLTLSYQPDHIELTYFDGPFNVRRIFVAKYKYEPIHATRDQSSYPSPEIVQLNGFDVSISYYAVSDPTNHSSVMVYFSTKNKNHYISGDIWSVPGTHGNTNAISDETKSLIIDWIDNFLNTP